MKKLNIKYIDLENSRYLLVMLTYLTSADLFMSIDDIHLIKKYIKKIIKICERNCEIDEN